MATWEWAIAIEPKDGPVDAANPPRHLREWAARDMSARLRTTVDPAQLTASVGTNSAGVNYLRLSFDHG